MPAVVRGLSKETELIKRAAYMLCLHSATAAVSRPKAQESIVVSDVELDVSVSQSGASILKDS